MPGGDGERFDAGLDQVAHDLLRVLAVDGLDHLALGAQALPRLSRVLERGGRIRLDHDDPAGERPRGLRARQVEDLPEALGRDQADSSALRLQHRVRGDGRAVLDVGDVFRSDLALVADPPDAEVRP